VSPNHRKEPKWHSAGHRFAAIWAIPIVIIIHRWSYLAYVWWNVAADCEDDDLDSDDIRRLLAAATRLLRRGQSVPGRHPSSVDPARLSRHLLGRHEQRHVQPNHLLLDERQVCPALTHFSC